MNKEKPLDEKIEELKGKVDYILNGGHIPMKDVREAVLEVMKEVEVHKECDYKDKDECLDDIIYVIRKYFGKLAEEEELK